MLFYDTNIVNGFYAKIFDMNKIELLAPCGNEESFMAAVSAGADAVYVGLKDFSARAKAKNFSYKQLNEICNYAKNKNVKVFVALNTLVKDSEIKNIIKSLEQISFAQADAIIVQDLGVANLSKKYFPKIALHASTQLVIHNSYGAKQAEKAGFKRAVLARELSFDDIKKIKNNSNIELEIFCHGALCFCVSGLCLFSSFIGGYSGNRGYCTQPCRRLWTADGKNGYFLSPKDFQLADYIKQIKNIGITSLKIEGRLKSADYVTKTVKAYRLLIDSDEKNYEQNLKQAKEILALDYARQKTTFNFNAKSENIFEPQKSKNLGLYLGKTENKTDTYFCLNCTDKIFVDDTLRIVDLQKDKSQTLTVKEINAQFFMQHVNSLFKSNTRVDLNTITESRLKESLLKYDGTPVLQFFREALIKSFEDDFAPKQTIILRESDKTEELSAGLNAKIYFDLLSYENSMDGVYIIDQPEDNVSQPAIKEYLLDCFRAMGENRQVIMVSHNPQFIVNLDVDNIIYLFCGDDGKLRFQSGALEYECADYSVLQLVADNIDGGLDSIQKRWKRYEKNNRV